MIDQPKLLQSLRQTDPQPAALVGNCFSIPEDLNAQITMQQGVGVDGYIRLAMHVEDFSDQVRKFSRAPHCLIHSSLESYNFYPSHNEAHISFSVFSLASCLLELANFMPEIFSNFSGQL